MLRSLRARLLAAVILSAAPLFTAWPANAQVSVEISFDSFHDQLAPYGAWVYSDRWGTVWQPGDVPADFRPYDTGGHWEYTDEYGWTWVSDYDWGDIAFHYGRWVYDPDDGWLWMPGYVWSPAWVVWRGNNDYLGWMPMPPDDDFVSGRGDIGVSVSWNDPDRYYSEWYGPSFGGVGALWVFVNYGHIADRDYHRYEAPPGQVNVLVRKTTNITNYTVVNNYVVNRSVDVRRVAQIAGHPIRPVPARAVIRHPNMVATVAHGEQVRAQMLHVTPRGNGRPNSAPAPSPAIVSKLSDRPVQHGAQRGHASHLFTKAALSQPGVMNHFRGGGISPAGRGPTNQTPTAAPAPNQPKPQDHAVKHNENGRARGQHESGAPPETPPNASMRPREGNANSRMRAHHEKGAVTPPAPSNPGPEPLPNRMHNNQPGPNSGGPRSHAHTEREHNAPPPEEPGPMRGPDNMEPRHGSTNAIRHEGAIPMGAPPPVHQAPGRENTQHTPPPNADRGEGHSNGKGKRESKPEDTPPPPH